MSCKCLAAASESGTEGPFTVMHKMANAQQRKDKEKTGPLLQPVFHLDIGHTELIERLTHCKVDSMSVLQHQPPRDHHEKQLLIVTSSVLGM